MKTCPCNTQIFLALKFEKFQLKNFDIFLIFAQNINCGFKLEPPRRGSSNEYTQSMFLSKNIKNIEFSNEIFNFKIEKKSVYCMGKFSKST